MARTRSTIYEVARRSGVSTATVSRAVGDGTGLSAATRDRVLAVAAELGWVPDGRARGLATRRTGIVGVLFHDLGARATPRRSHRSTSTRSSAAPSVRPPQPATPCSSPPRAGRTGRELAFSVAGKVDGLVVLARSLS